MFAAGTPEMLKGPFYCWYEGLSSAQVKEAHQTINETIEDEGPFDGVIGFSQGASVIISLLLHHEIHASHCASPFKFALFFCPIAVISPDVDFNSKHVERYARYYNGDLQASEANDESEEDEIPGDEGILSRAKPGGQARVVAIKKPTTAPKHRLMLASRKKRKALVEELVDLTRDMLKNVPSKAVSSSAWSRATLSPDRPQDFPRFMHPLTLRQRVRIPTVLVLGKDDGFGRQSELALGLCEKSKTKMVSVQGGHSIPVSPPELRMIAAAFEWAIHKGQQL